MERLWLTRYDPHVPPSLDYPAVPMHDLLRQAAARHPDRPAIRYYGRTIRYRDLDRLTDQWANALRGLGIMKGTRVGLILPNLPQYLIAFYGALKAGAIAVPINPLYVERELEQQIVDAGAETVVVLDLFYEKLRSLQDRINLRHLIVTSATDYLPWQKRLLAPFVMPGPGPPRIEVRPPVYRFQALLQAAPASRPDVVVIPDDVALLQYTGGTTGVAKGCILTHRNIVVNALQSAAWVNLREGEDRVLAVVPFFHAYGMTTCMNVAIARACAVILLPRFHAKEVIETIQRERPTFFSGVQLMYIAITNDPHAGRADLRSVRACISGAGPLYAEVQDRFETLTHGTLVEGYGQSEASPVTHCNPLGRRWKKGSIGVPFPDTDAKIVDLETGTRTLAVGEIGELAVRGPQVMNGYWNRPDETAAVLRDGWLYTGDMARMDEDGFFSIVDRKKDMIKTKGENVYPREVEEVLHRHPKVKEAVVVGLPDEAWGEVIKAYVVLKTGESATPEELIDFCRKDLAPYKVPRMLEVRPELPKTIVGKVLRRILVDEELTHRASARVMTPISP